MHGLGCLKLQYNTYYIKPFTCTEILILMLLTNPPQAQSSSDVKPPRKTTRIHLPDITRNHHM
ncbi:hypothetical protein HanRHA438_Chr15g0721501 [Helianthus annuus]|nr:hypothetical protein HanRHA438_Chr15g0721501 [Helianthus annuus]